MPHNEDIFDLVDACDLRAEEPKHTERPERKRPDLLELYTRRPKRIEVTPEEARDYFLASIACIAFGVIIYASLVMCLG